MIRSNGRSNLCHRVTKHLTHMQLWIPLIPRHLHHFRAISFSIYIASIIVVTSLRPPATSQHTTRDSQLDPVCAMTRILNIPTRFLQYLHTLLVSPSHSSIVPALTFGHQHCVLVSRVLYTVTTSASLYNNYLHIVSRRSQTSLVRSPQAPTPRGQSYQLQYMSPQLGYTSNIIMTLVPGSQHHAGVSRSLSSWTSCVTVVFSFSVPNLGLTFVFSLQHGPVLVLRFSHPSILIVSPIPSQGCSIEGGVSGDYYDRPLVISSVSIMGLIIIDLHYLVH